VGKPLTDETEWTSLDMNPDANPDVVFNLDDLHYYGTRLPFADEEFDEIHAYEVLEHVGRLGNYRGFFMEFQEYWRILKPGGRMIGTTPGQKGHWTFGDPGHTRVICHQTMLFLTESLYSNLGETVASDYRSLVDPCWWHVEADMEQENKYVFCLRKEKE
jgi:cyclopropane fatty-acyl-phospholipid synthase-like methyltransferase